VKHPLYIKSWVPVRENNVSGYLQECEVLET